MPLLPNGFLRLWTVDIPIPCFGNSGIPFKEFIASWLCDIVQGTGEIHALRAQKHPQCGKKTCYRRDVDNEQSPWRSGH